LVLAMTAGVLLLFALPSTRTFYALGLPPARALVWCAVVGAIAFVALEGWWTIDQRNLPPAERTPRFAARRHPSSG
jgi:hypothetical protein